MVASPQTGFDPVILREYDIRGTVGKNLDVATARLLGIRFGQMMMDKGLSSVCVGRDGRLSSPSLSKSLIEGLRQTTVSVKDIGMGPTPLLYFSVKSLHADAGIMVTGSHNPPQDNGFKMTLADRPFFGEDIQSLNNSYSVVTAQAVGTYEEIDVQDDYQNRILQDYKPGKRLRVVWDPGNGAAGLLVEKLVQCGLLAVDSLVLNGEINGHFPSHHPDPTVPENLQQLIDAVVNNGFDLGIAFDGDADRIGVVDGRGRILWGDQLMVLWSRDILTRHPGSTIIADVKTSQTLFDDIQARGGVPLMARTGHSLIKKKIAEVKAVLAGEMSGHIFFADTYYGYDDAIYAALRLLNILHHTDQTLAQLFDTLPQSISTPEIRIPCDDNQKFKIIASIQKKLRQESIPFNDVDGVRVRREDGWWLLRASNTQPILVARCESNHQAGLERLKDELQEYLSPFKLGSVLT